MLNKIKKLIKEGKPAFGAQLRLGSPAIAEMFSLAGFDWLVIDSEHAPQTPTGIQTQLQAVAAGGATPIVRLQKNDPDTIRLYLDMGAHGVLVPFINTAADAEAGVKACLYPPRGIRGFGPSRGSKYGMDPTYFDRADDEIIFLPIIESAEAVRNIDEIYAVKGIEACMVGPVDLSISLGMKLDVMSAPVQQAIAQVSAAARRAGKIAGNAVYGDWSNPDNAAAQIDAGFTLLLMGGDEWMLNNGCSQLAAGLKSLRGQNR